MFTPGIDGFTFEDLHHPAGLERLYARFLMELRAAAPDVALQYESYRRALKAGAPRGGLTSPQESDLLIALAGLTSRFVGRLFRVEKELASLTGRLNGEFALFDFKREFVTKRVFKKGATDRPLRDELPELDQRMALLLSLGFDARLPPVEAGQPNGGPDHERALAETIIVLLDVERHFGGHRSNEAVAGRWRTLRERLLADERGRAAFGSTLVGDDVLQVRGLLALADRWTFARAAYTHTFHGWSTVAQQKPLAFDRLVELKLPDPSKPEIFEGPDSHLRRRDGFGLTDPRASLREVVNEVDTCVICHEREKDSCSKGFKEKDPSQGTYKKNPLGIPLAGCPLDERISEMHVLEGRGRAGPAQLSAGRER